MGARLLAAAWLAFACAAAAWPAAAGGANLPSGFRDDVVFSGLEEPTAVRFAADGRVFVAEKAGRVLVYDGPADPTPTVFADLRTQVYDRSDRGLLGLALDPGFPTRPYVYLLYTYDHVLGEAGAAPKWGEPDRSGDECPKPGGTGVDECPVSGRLVRLTAAGDHAGEVGGEVDEQVLVEDWCAQYSSHSVGDLEFGPDGALYASGGEGADANSVDYGQNGWPQRNQCGDPPAGIGGVQSPPSAEGGALRAQDVRTPATPFDPTGLNGSLIRIDPDTGEGLPGNPLFASADANERRLVAHGFRNPFRFAIDPSGQRAFVANVGWNRFEEIDRVPLGGGPLFNSGWPCYEGPAPNLNYQGLGLSLCEGLYAEPAATTAPFFSYRHGYPAAPEGECADQVGAAVSGMTFYDGGAFPSAYDGAFFFADPVRGCIYAMTAGEGGEPDPLTATPFLSGGSSYPGIDLEVGPDGGLYYVSLFGEGPLGEEFGPGEVHRISYDPDAPRARLSADRRWGAASVGQPLQVRFDASASFSVRDEPLGYEWDLDGDGDFEAPGPAVRTASFSAHQNVTVGVRVSDGGGESVARLTVFPGDTPPQPEIEAPQPTLSWAVGEEIEFSGDAADEEDGGIGSLNLYWRARLYHCPSSCHVHPLQAFNSTGSGSLIAPNHDYPAHIELALTAVDSRGLAATTAVQLHPRAVNLAIASDPPGLELGAGLSTAPAPFDLAAIEGAELVLSAPARQQLGGRTFDWQGWSDGGERAHSIVAEPGGSFTATYAAVGEEVPPRPGPQPLEPPRSTDPGVPQTLLRGRPAKATASRSARFAFASSQPGSRFRCRLNAGRFRPCVSPRTYRGLRPGPQVFRVYAIGEGGADPTPLVFRWRVL